MDETALLIIALLVIVGMLVLWLLLRQRRTGSLREEFGDEYDRTLESRGGRSAAERDLEDRKKRVAELNIRPLDNDERGHFRKEWLEVKALFVDAPREAVLRADRMLKDVLTKRGFPMADFDRRYEDLTVDHRDTARHYRAGHTIARDGDATTEDLRQAMGHYEALFDDMVAPESGAERSNEAGMVPTADVRNDDDHPFAVTRSSDVPATAPVGGHSRRRD
ncbi:hypothetical protein [Pseudopontixanthobacter vadosimaris]|uniref:hypothetical protein n=1 Tax=Pseudopontixanthobacter vadosimaris TaxID=2726450 RepID=UPI0014727AD1|nr:hypothetical protein [Pseudopontixanthobacter vadosimaris]